MKMQTRKPQKTTMKEQVYEIIREMILSQEYQLGEKINIDMLAARLNVSNSPIREALMVLEKHGLVQNIPNIGSRVISFSPAVYNEICATLHIIVSGAYEFCLRHQLVDAAISDMRRALKIQKEAADAHDMRASIKYALAFDKALVSATKNSHLLSIYEQMEDVFFLLALQNRQSDSSQHEGNLYEHSMILECIEKNDPDAAKKWLLKHYDKKI